MECYIFSKTIKRDPNYAEAYVNRGLIHHQLGDRNLAFADLKKGAECFRDRGKTNAAEKIFSLIEKLQQNNSTQMSAIG
jgi:tetratricopeptide (TPR) repeat protein